jgi:hypothetical protein
VLRRNSALDLFAVNQPVCAFTAAALTARSESSLAAKVAAKLKILKRSVHRRVHRSYSLICETLSCARSLSADRAAETKHQSVVCRLGSAAPVRPVWAKEQIPAACHLRRPLVASELVLQEPWKVCRIASTNRISQTPPAPIHCSRCRFHPAFGEGS